MNHLVNNLQGALPRLFKTSGYIDLCWVFTHVFFATKEGDQKKGVSKIMVLQHGWLMENPMNMHDLGYP